MQLSALTAQLQASATSRASLRGAKATPRVTTTMMSRHARSPPPSLFFSGSRRLRPVPSSSVTVAALGDDATEAWLDLAAFVTGTSGKKGGPFEELADAIGTIFFFFFFFFFPSLSSLSTQPFARSRSHEFPRQKTGKAVYVDVQGWHVYLRDVKVGGAPLSGILASELGPLASQGKATPAAVDELLAKVPLKLGGGKATVSLLDSIPSFALGDLHRAVEDWARNGGR